MCALLWIEIQDAQKESGINFLYFLFFFFDCQKLSEYISIYLFMAWFFGIMVTAGILNFMMLCQSQWP